MKNGKQTAILLFAHGSRVGAANRAVEALAAQVQAAGGFDYVRAAFLEAAEPDLPAAIDQAVRAGYRHLLVMPYFLSTGVHLRHHLPELVKRQFEIHPGLEIQITDSLEGHPQMPSLILDRIQTEMQPR